ncbi:hypothetical protein SNEBB_007672 [Seison nebaliae]|nr:hypothetical protein SNEBB_007672 [Seison nebaliae]
MSDLEEQMITPEKKSMKRSSKKGEDDLKDDQMDEMIPMVKDRFQMVYIIMLIFGIGVLMPWNVMINQAEFFRNYKLNTPTSINAAYRLNFVTFFGVICQTMNFIMSTVNLFTQQSGKDTRVRIPIAQVTIIIVLISMVFVSVVDTYDRPGLCISLVYVAGIVMNIATGFFQTSVFSLASILPPRYTGVIIIGNNICGLIISIFAILSKLKKNSDERVSTAYYFIMSIVVMLVSLIFYFFLPMLKFFQVCDTDNKAKNQSKNPGKNEDERLINESPESPIVDVVALPENRPNFIQIFLEVKWLLLSVWFAFFVTLAIFPGLLLGIKSDGSPFSNIFHHDVVTFLTFNLFSVIGGVILNYVPFKRVKLIPLTVLVRGLILIPYFIFCNYYPTDVRRFPVLLKSVYPAWIGNMILATTNGYFAGLIMMAIPNNSSAPNVAAMMGGCFLVLGVLTGLQFTWVLSKIVGVY